MAQKLPAIQFYPGDWKKDLGVQSLSFHDRGVWFEILLLMHESEDRGKLVLNGKAMPRAALARVLGIDLPTLESTLKAILDAGVAREEEGVIINRRMVKDEMERREQKEAGKSGGNPALCENYNKPGFLYAIQRSSDGRVKIGISQNPTKRLYKLRYQSKGDSLELLAVLHVPDMGAAEKEQHARFAHCASGEWFALSPDEISSLLFTLKGKPKGQSTPSSSSSSSSSSSEQKPSPPTRDPNSDFIPDGLVAEIVCAHPKSVSRHLTARSVRQRDCVAVIEAIRAEVEETGATAEAAAVMLLGVFRGLAEKVPRDDWRFMSDVDEFCRKFDYRRPPEDFITKRGGSNGTGKPQRTGAQERNDRASATIAEMLAKRGIRVPGDAGRSTAESVSAPGPR